MRHLLRPFNQILKCAGILLVPVFFIVNGCSSTTANRNPTGQVFPTVVGYSLDKERTELPGALAGHTSILLVGYKQRTQFDIDRWLMGLLQSDADAKIIEIPTIPGLLPTIASGWIDNGMRSGIPSEDWGSVVTLYGDAATPVVKMTGNENGRSTRVIVLDASGAIVWFDDSGYSPRKAIEVAKLISKMNER